MKAPFIWLIRLYQKLLSPVLAPRCRFYPSCSQYAILALQEHKMLFALWLIGKRLLKCQPLHPGGIDEVPVNQKKVSHFHV